MFHLLKVGSNQNELSIIGTFALAAQKLLPSMQQCYNSISALRSNKGSIIEILKILDQKYFEFDYKKSGPLNFKINWFYLIFRLNINHQINIF